MGPVGRAADVDAHPRYGYQDFGGAGLCAARRPDNADADAVSEREEIGPGLFGDQDGPRRLGEEWASSRRVGRSPCPNGIDSRTAVRRSGSAAPQEISRDMRVADVFAQVGERE